MADLTTSHHRPTDLSGEASPTMMKTLCNGTVREETPLGCLRIN